MNNISGTASRRGFMWAFVVLLAAGGVVRVSAQAPNQAETLNSIGRVWQALQQPGSSASYRLTSRISLSKPGTELLPAIETVITYHDSPDGLSLDNQSTRYQDGGREKRERELYLVNKSYAVQLRGDVKSGQLIVVDRPKMHPDDKGREWIASSQPFHRLIWFAPEQTFRLSMLIDPGLTQVTKVEPERADLVRITFQVKSGLSAEVRQQLRGVTSGWLLLNKRWHYRLEEADIIYKEDQYQAAYRCQYLDEPGSEYLLRTMTTDSKFTVNGEATPRTSKTVQEFEKLPPTDDPSIFYMSHYGLPEPEGVTAPTKPIPLWVWLLAGAGAFAILAVVLRLVIPHRASTATPAPAPKSPVTTG